MYYKLKKNFGLRGWSKLPRAIRDFDTGNTMFLTETVYQALSFCNGNIDCDGIVIPQATKDMVKTLVEQGVVTACEKGDFIEPRQEYKLSPCRYISTAHWSITGKCNMCCRHCFMSAPQAKFGELSHEKCMSIIKELSEAGIGKISLTGGEPLIRPDFLEIVDAILAEGILITQIYTNGMLVDDALLDALTARNTKPEFSLSFDGVGWHDWLRGIDGAEDIAVNAIKLLKSRGFAVSIESAFHRKSIDSLEATMHLLAELGVDSWKTNPVSNSGNWTEEDRSLDLTMEELYDAYLDFIDKYYKAGAPISVMLGGFFMCEKGGKDFIAPCKKPVRSEENRLKEPLCMSARTTMYIAADGKLLPCIPLSGLPSQEDMPSLNDMTLAEALTDSLYLERIETPVSALLSHNEECASCEHRLACNGGCRAAALMENNTGDYLGIDTYTCRYFRDGYEEKIKEIVNRQAG